MASKKFQIKYDEVKKVQSLFQQEADELANMIKNLKSKLDPLQGGDWIGKGATQFFNEMTNDILPALTRAQKAVADAAQASARSMQISQQAEKTVNTILSRMAG